jgi:hypothetical protein
MRMTSGIEHSGTDGLNLYRFGALWPRRLNGALPYAVG